jgi:DNA-binding transcriptional ArsR family regulator
MRSSAVRDDRLDRVFHALADPTRRRLVRRLAKAPATVGELAAPFDMSLVAVSKHIRVLEAAELVVRTVRGRTHTCALAAGRLREATDWLDAYREFWEGTLASLARYVEPAR